MDALKLLTADHNRVRGLFTRFKEAKEQDNLDEMSVLCATIVSELEVHTTIEEEIFYPDLRDANEEIHESITEGYKEHHVAKQVMEELKATGPNTEHWAAKVTVLIENVEHHAEEEESNLFPMVRKATTQEDRSALGPRGAAPQTSALGRSGPRHATAPGGGRYGAAHVLGR